MSGFLTIENFKGCGIQRCVKTGIIPEFSQCDPLLPLSWTSMNKAPEIAFQTLINSQFGHQFEGDKKCSSTTVSLLI